MTIDKNKAMAGIGLFARLSPALKRRVAAASGLQRFSQGTRLFQEGERCHYIYGIVSGTVALASGSGESESVIDFFGTGETVLVPPALLDLPYLLSARATTDGMALLVPAGQFRAFVESDVTLAAECARLLARHWRILVKQTQRMKTQDARARLAQFILERAGKSTGAATLRLPGLKKDLATHLGMAPETLSRAFQRLRAHGVEAKGDAISVMSLKNLMKFGVGPSRGHGARLRLGGSSRSEIQKDMTP